MSDKMIVTFYRKESTWFGYKVEVDAETNEEAKEKIKNYDYVMQNHRRRGRSCPVEEYGVFYFPDGTEINERD